MIESAPGAVLVDLRGPAFMESTGLHCLLEATAHADTAAVRIAVMNGSGPAHRLLTLARGDAVETVDDASQLDPPATAPEGASGSRPIA